MHSTYPIGRYSPFDITMLFKKDGRRITEPSLIAVELATDRVADYGSAAARYMAEPSEGIAVCNPFREGAIADFDLACTLIKSMMARGGAFSGVMAHIRRPSVLLCVPFEITGVDRTALSDCLSNCGAGAVDMTEQTIDSIDKAQCARYDVIIELGYTEHSFEQLLASIEADPILYIGSKDIKALRHFLCGWNHAAKSSAATQWWSGFNEYLSRSYSDSSSRDWAGLIAAHEPDGDSTDAFFRLLHKFRSEQNK